jgi:hypothetical protein
MCCYVNNTVNTFFFHQQQNELCNFGAAPSQIRLSLKEISVGISTQGKALGQGHY